MRTTMRKVAGAIVLGAVLFPFLAGAQVPSKPPESIVSKSASPIGAVVTLLEKLGGWFWGIILALAVILIVYAAFLFLTSGGDEEEVKKAKDYIIYAVIALIVAILATGIVYLTRVFLGETTPPPPPPGGGGVMCGGYQCPPSWTCNSATATCEAP